MDFGYDARTEELRDKLLAFMDSHVYPAERVFADQVAAAEAAGDIWQRPAVIDELKAEARSQGLWNLFLTVRTHKDQIGELAEKYGAGLTNLQYAPLAEITGRSGAIAPEALNCAAPDTGNMEVLAEFGSAEQVERWLLPLLDGEIRSAFCMTEPDVASSDATNITTRIERDGDEYVINGRKWWSSGAMDPRCKVFIVMGKTEPGRGPAPPAVDDLRAVRHARHHDQAQHAGLRLHRLDPRRPRRGRVRRRPGAGREPDRRRG